MNKSPKNCFKVLFIIFLANLFWLQGCGGENSNLNQSNIPHPANSNSGKKNLPSDKLEELLEFIRLPEMPEEVVWLEDTKSNPKKILAVLQYTAETAPKLIAIVEKNKQPEPVEIGIENWFPEELRAQARLSGAEMLKGTVYGANQFFNIPYGEGKIVRIEGTNYFVLELLAN